MSEAFIPWVSALLPQSVYVLDAGCGPNGSYWWWEKPPGCHLVAVDRYFRPQRLPENAEFAQVSLEDFCRQPGNHNRFDLVVADHILEHVENPLAVLIDLADVLQPSGKIHVGIPDADMFTDRFYHLIHPDGGGHIARVTLEGMRQAAVIAGLSIADQRPWPDDWLWLDKLYNWQLYGNRYTTQADIQFIAEVFRKELTPEKGYFYGWELLLGKERTLPELSAQQREEISAQGHALFGYPAADEPPGKMHRPHPAGFAARLKSLLRRLAG